MGRADAGSSEDAPMPPPRHWRGDETINPNMEHLQLVQLGLTQPKSVGDSGFFKYPFEPSANLSPSVRSLGACASLLTLLLCPKSRSPSAILMVRIVSLRQPAMIPSDLMKIIHTIMTRSPNPSSSHPRKRCFTQGPNRQKFQQSCSCTRSHRMHT
jgi:hypothetical protein